MALMGPIGDELDIALPVLWQWTFLELAGFLVDIDQITGDLSEARELIRAQQALQVMGIIASDEMAIRFFTDTPVGRDDLLLGLLDAALTIEMTYQDPESVGVGITDAGRYAVHILSSDSIRAKVGPA